MYFGEDKKLLETSFEIVQEIVAGLPRAEQSEYQKRKRIYQNCFSKIQKLGADRNNMYDNRKLRKKEFEKTMMYGVIGFFAFLTANWFFNFQSEEKISSFVYLAFAYAAYIVISEKIYESEYAIKIKLCELEIERYEAEIANLEVFYAKNRYIDMENFEESSEETKEKMRFDNLCYHTTYCIEILESMCVASDVVEQARLRMAK